MWLEAVQLQYLPSGQGVFDVVGGGAVTVFTQRSGRI